MALEVEEIRNALNSVKAKGINYFDCMSEIDEGPRSSWHEQYADRFWEQLDASLQDRSAILSSELLSQVKMISKCITLSPLLTEADRRDLGNWAKTIRASLKLRKYYAWDTEVLHDEGSVLGVQAAGQSDSDPMHPVKARLVFERGISNLLGLVDLLEAEPVQLVNRTNLNPQISARYEPNTAFVMMQIDAKKPELEDVYNAYKECFGKFNIAAVRADEIEHQEAITEKIIQKIKFSEFLLADLTAERPNIYYEIGYAHALGRKVIMYRSHATKLHFDLAGYNCPEYSNLTDLREKIMRRLENITNKRPKEREE